MADGAEDTPALSHHQRSQGANSSHRGGLEERPRLLVLFYRLNCVIGIHKVFIGTPHPILYRSTVFLRL
jgi:hypothetical protein